MGARKNIGKAFHNFGDELSHMIIKRLFGRRVKWSSLEECELIAIGSLLNAAFNKSQTNKIKVWGSGFIEEGNDNDLKNLSNFEFHAVRGHVTKNRLGLENIALGDPRIAYELSF